MSRLQPVRGTADLLPDSMAKHRLVINAAFTASERYGFQEMATPIFEFSEVFSRPLGESSDVVTKENYSFADRGGEMLTLRPQGQHFATTIGKAIVFLGDDITALAKWP